MGRYDFRPSRVHQAATQLIRTGRVKAPPPWYDTVGNNPPSQILVRTQPVQHTGHRKGVRKPSKLFKPQTISYPEDKLRKSFFSDHPWELARPRVVLEDSGDDYRRQQWDSIRQRGAHLSGENVVQRQAWLMEHRQLSRSDAYDQARREFYGERMREEIEKRVAKEEATSTGAYFGRSMIGIGNDLEDQTFEKFRTWADKAVTAMDQARAAAYSGLDSPTSNADKGPIDSALGEPGAEQENGAAQIAETGERGQ